MRVNKPIAITDAMLTSATVAEPDTGENIWSNSTVYIAGDKIINTATHRLFESLSGTRSDVAISVASPGLVTWSNHGLPAGTPVRFTTTGTLPTGLTPGTDYFVVNPATNTFQVAASVGGTAINTTGSPTGTHTATANPNVNRDPPTDDGSWWTDAGPSNRWAALDLNRNTGSVGASPMTYVITPGQRIDAIGVVGMVADTVTLTVKVGGVVKWTYSASLLDRRTLGWYDYFFGDFRYRKAIALFEVPPFSGAEITVTLTRATGNVTCGGIVLGMGTYIGRTLHDAEREGLNYSKIDRDDQGNVTLIPRRSVPRVTARIRTSKSNVPTVLDLIDDLNAVPALWSGLDDQDSGYFPAFLILGVYRTLKVDADQPDDALVDLEVEEI